MKKVYKMTLLIDTIKDYIPKFIFAAIIESSHYLTQIKKDLDFFCSPTLSNFWLITLLFSTFLKSPSTISVAATFFLSAEINRIKIIY